MNRKIFAALLLFSFLIIAKNVSASSSNPVQVAYYNNTTSLNGAYSVFALGSYAYVVSAVSNSLTVFDITNPANPVEVAYYTNATSLNSPRSVFALGSYAYVVSAVGNSLTTFNITDPKVTTNTTGGTDSNDWFAGYPYASPITSSASGTLETVGVNVYSGGTGNIRVAIYDDSGGTPNNLLCESGSTALSGTGWNDVDVSSCSLSITASTNYWLAFQSDTSSDRFYVSTESAWQTAQSYGAFPDPFDGSSAGSRPNMRMTYTSPLINEVAYYTNATSLNGSRSVFVLGSHAYVTSASGNSLTTFDITNPANPVEVAYYTNATSLNAARPIFALGSYVYVLAVTGNALTTFDITDPANPIQVAYYTNATSLNNPISIFVLGGYAYVTTMTGNSLTTFDITNPANPAEVAYYANATSLNSPRSVFALGSYAYVVSMAGKSLTTFDITNPANPIQVAYYTNATSLNNPYSVFALGNYAYVASYTGKSLTTFDITPPPYVSATFNYSSVAFGILSSGTSNNTALQIYNVTVDANANYKSTINGLNFTGDGHEIPITDLRTYCDVDKILYSEALPYSTAVQETPVTQCNNVYYTATENYHYYWLTIPSEQYAATYATTVTITYSLV